MINTELKIKDTDLRLEKYQIDIYNGLRDIGEEISSMYCDGVRIFKSDFSSRPYIRNFFASLTSSGQPNYF